MPNFHMATFRMLLPLKLCLLNVSFKTPSCRSACTG